MLLRLSVFKRLLIDRFTLFCFGGGGGSGSSGGNDTLWNAQAKKVDQDMAMSGDMYDTWKQYSPGYIKNANDMTKEAMDGTLTDRMRTKAGADADQATSTAIDAATKSTDRFGATLNTNAVAHDTKAAALQGAANKAGVMSKATEWGEGQKWARNQDAYSLTSGMPGNAVAASNAAGNSMSSMAGMQNNANSTAAQSASGYGMMGATLASKMYKSGGLVKVSCLVNGGVPVRATRRLSPGGKVNRLAVGGVPQSPVANWRDRMSNVSIGNRSSGTTADPIASTVSGAATMAVLKEAAPVVKDLGGKAYGEIRNAGERLFNVDQTQPPAEVIDKSTQITDPNTPVDSTGNPTIPEGTDIPLEGSEQVTSITDGGAGATEIAAEEAATTAATETAAAEATTAAAAEATTVAAAEATAAAATETAVVAGVETVAAANAWNPLGWAMGLGLAAAAASRADGGSMEREPTNRVDMLKGGPVEGPGTETSDSVPAWLSTEEYVLNAPAVRMIGKEKLDELNEKGLQERHGKQARMVDGEAKPNGLFNGGMLGIAMGAGAQTYNQLEQYKKQNERMETELQLRQNADARETERQGVVMQDAKLKLGEATRKATAQGKVDALQGEDEGLDNLNTEIGKTGGSFDSYVKDRQGDAPFSAEQIGGMKKAYDSAVNPARRYATQLKQADALRTTDTERSLMMENNAHKRAAGDAISAFNRGDGKAIASLYNLFPNGHTVENVAIVNGQAVVTHKDGKTQTVPRDEFLRGLQAYHDPDKAAQGDLIDRRLENMERSIIDKNNQFNARLAAGRSGSGSRSSGAGGGAGGDGEADFIKLAGPTGLKLFTDDGAANAELTSTARKFYANTQGSGQARGETALIAADAFLKRKTAEVEAYKKENGTAIPTEEYVLNKVAPLAIDPDTGIAYRKFSRDPSDPGKGSFKLGDNVTAGAPQVVRDIAFGDAKGLPAVISTIKSGKFGDQDKAAWNAALEAKLKSSGLKPDQQDAVKVQWGADGMYNYVTKYVKPEAVKPDAAKPSAKQRTADEVEVLGERPVSGMQVIGDAASGIGNAVSSAAKWYGGKVDASEAVKYERYLADKSITDRQASDYRALLAKNPELQKKYGRDPVTLASTGEVDEKVPLNKQIVGMYRN